MTLHKRIARTIEDWAAYERRTYTEQIARAIQHYPHMVKPCEGCGRTPVVAGGLCPSCLDVAARILKKGP